MEYIYYPDNAIEWLSCLTEKNGVLYITFPFIYPFHNPVKYDMLRYTKSAVIELVEEGYFKVLDIIPRKMTAIGEAIYRQFLKVEGMHAAKGENHNELGWIVKAKRL